MKIYLRILSVLYFLGAALHFLDIFNLRLNFSNMNLLWQGWIVFLLIGDAVAAIFLWKYKIIGEYFFLTIAGVQLFAYGLFTTYFGKQYELIIFHIVTVGIYLVLKFRIYSKQ